MTLDRTNIDELFQRQLKELEQAPPDMVWYNVEDELDRISMKKKKVWIKNISVAASILLAFGMGYFVANKTSEPNTIAVREDVPLVEEAEIRQAEEVEDKTMLVSEDNVTTDELPTQDVAAQPQVYTVDISSNESIRTQDEFIINTDTQDDESLVVADVSEDSQLMEARPQNLEYIASKSPSSIPNSLSNDIVIANNNNNVQKTNDLLFPVETKEEENKWIVGGQMAPLYSFRNLVGDELATQIYDSKESGLLAYAGGVNLNYQASNRISVQAGVYYSRMGQNINGITVNYEEQEDAPQLYQAALLTDVDSDPKFYGEVVVSNSTGNIESNQEEISVRSSGSLIHYSMDGAQYRNQPSESQTLQQNFDYLEIPLLVKYKVIDRKVDFNVLSGLSTHILVGNSTYIIVDESKERLGQTSDIKNLNYSGALGMGIEYPLTSSMVISVEPLFKYYLNSVNESNQVDSHPYSFGLFTGLSFIF